MGTKLSHCYRRIVRGLGNNYVFFKARLSWQSSVCCTGAEYAGTGLRNRSSSRSRQCEDVPRKMQPVGSGHTSPRYSQKAWDVQKLHLQFTTMLLIIHDSSRANHIPCPPALGGRRQSEIVRLQVPTKNKHLSKQCTSCGCTAVCPGPGIKVVLDL
jgi:hypothetical protein